MVRHQGRGSYSSKKGRGRSYKKKFKIPKGLRGLVRTGGYYGAPKQELKFHDVDFDVVDAKITHGTWDPVATNGGTDTLFSLCTIAQGATENQRLGRKCTIKSIGFRYQVGLDGLDANALVGDAYQIKLTVILDKQANGALGAAATIWQTATDINSFKLLANKERYRTLMEHEHTFVPVAIASDGAGLISTGGQFAEGNWFHKCNIPLEFNGATGALTEIRSNNLLMFINITPISAQDGGAVAATRLGYIFGKMRLRFVG